MAPRLVLAIVALLTGGCEYGGDDRPPPEPDFLPIVVDDERAQKPLLYPLDYDFVCTIEVRRDGSFRRRGRKVSQKELGEHFAIMANRRRDMKDPLQPSEVSLALVIDRRVPWSRVETVLECAAEPDVRIYKLAFEAASSGPWHGGWVCAWLSKSGSEDGGVVLREGEQMPESAEDEEVRLQVEGSPSAEFVVRAIGEICRRGSDPILVLSGLATEEGR